MTDFARDLKEMMDAWDKYRAQWIKQHGNDEGFEKWYWAQIAGLEKKAKSQSRLSAICDRELQRVGLAANYKPGDVVSFKNRVGQYKARILSPLNDENQYQARILEGPDMVQWLVNVDADLITGKA